MFQYSQFLYVDMEKKFIAVNACDARYVTCDLLSLEQS